MKTRKRNLLALGLTALTSLFIPTQSFAGNTLMNSTGVNDETLFLILATVAFFQLLIILVIAGVIKSIASNADIWKMRWNNTTKTIITGALVLSSTPLLAAGSDFDRLITMDDTGFIALITINIVLFFTFVFLTAKLNGLIKMMMKDEEGRVPATFMDKINNMLTDAVPLEKEGSVEMDHEYDGIRELDNNLPPWWLWGFYVSIVFAFVYVINYHVTDNGMLQKEEYAAEMQEAEEAKAAFVATQETTVDENNVEFLSDAGDLASGAKIFKLYCGPCHGESGGSMPGGVGPNLTDDYWIHGGSVTDIYKTIKYGVPEKGMVSWEAQLNPTKIQQVSSYIKSLRGTNPDNPKEPQGELYVEEDAAPKVDSEAPTDSTKAAAEDGEEVTLVE